MPSMGDLYNAANLQQQMQGLQPIVDYGAAQRQLAETLLKQRMDEDARRSLLTWEYRQRLAAQAQQQQFERQQSEARNLFTAAENVKEQAGRERLATQAQTFTAAENVKEQAAREKLAIASQTAYMDRLDKADADRIKAAELADRRKQASLYKDQGVFQKPGEDIDDYFQRAKKEIENQQNDRIDSAAEDFAGLNNQLLKISSSLANDQRETFRRAGIRAVKNEKGLLTDAEKGLLETGRKGGYTYETFVSDADLKPDRRAKIEDAYQQGVDAARAVYQFPPDVLEQRKLLEENIKSTREHVLTGLVKSHDDYARFLRKAFPQNQNQPSYNETVARQVNPIASLQERTNSNVAAQKVVRPGVIGAGATGSSQAVEGLFPTIGRLTRETAGPVGATIGSTGSEVAGRLKTDLFGSPSGYTPLSPETSTALENAAKTMFYTVPSRPTIPVAPSIGIGNLRSAEQEDFNRRFMLLPNGKVVPRLPTDVGDIARQQMDAAAGLAPQPQQPFAPRGYFPGYLAPPPPTIPTTNTPSVFNPPITGQVNPDAEIYDYYRMLLSSPLPYR